MQQKEIRLILRNLFKIVASPFYLFTVVVVAVLTLIFSIWLPNLGLIWRIIISSKMSALDKSTFLWYSLGALTTNFSNLSAVLTVIVSILIGLNVAVTVFYFRKRIIMQKANGLGASGILLGLLGVGCASCGSVIFSSFIGVSATAAFAAALPFGGQEFSIASVLILLTTIYIILKKTDNSLVCKVEPEK